jgi:hypothetical protein
MASGRLDERLEWRDDIDEASDEVLSPSDADTTAELVAWAVGDVSVATIRNSPKAARFTSGMESSESGSPYDA